MDITVDGIKDETHDGEFLHLITVVPIHKVISDQNGNSNMTLGE
jgi:hypothetical protein